MNLKKIRRSLAFAVAMILMISMIPVMVLATETENESTEPTVEATVDPTVEATDASNDYSVSPMATIISTTKEVISGVSVTFEYDDDEYYGGTLSVADGVATIAFNDDEGLGNEGIITVTNTTSEKITLTFYYEISGSYTASKFTMDGVVATNPKTVTVNLDAHSTTSTTDSTVFRIVIPMDSQAPTMVLKSFSIGQATPKATVSHNAHGSVKVDGTTVASGNSVNTKEGGSVYEAVPGSGAQFLGWIDEATNTVLSTANPATIPLGQDTTVRAVFGHSTVPCFRVGTGLLFEGLQGAINKAKSGSVKTIISVNDATLTGSYEIPSGVTLLIPFDSQDTCYTTELKGYVTYAKPEEYVTPKPYRTLTLGKKASITVASGGAISVSAKVSATQMFNAAPHGDVGFIKMSDESSITVQSGGNLYVYGFIVPNGSEGSGTITVKSGGKIYECFQIMDWRGGNASLSMAADFSKLGSITAWLAKKAFEGYTGNSFDNKGVFPLSQYYVQNVEVPLVLEYGATEYGVTLVDVAINGVTQVQIAFIGSKSDSNFTGMFRIASGSITKRYDGTADRLIIDVNGTLNIEKMYTVIAEVGLSGYSIDAVINTDKYPIPMQSNMTVNVNSGAKVILNQDMNMLPGSQINIAENGTLQLTGSHKLFLYDKDHWNNYIYLDAEILPVKYAPGRINSRDPANLPDARIVVNGTLDGTSGNIYTTNSDGTADIISTGNGKAILKAGSNMNCYQVTQANTKITYQTVKVYAAKLKHENGNLTATSGTFYHAHYICCGDSTSNPSVAKHGTWATAHTKSEIPATCTEANKISCSCSTTVHTTVSALGHNMVAGTVVAPTCETDGYTPYTCANGCGLTEKRNIEGKLGHSWTITYTWSDDHSTCTASAKCANADHPVTEVAEIAKGTITVVTVEPTFDQDGSTTWTAVFNSAPFDKSKQDTKVLPQKIAVASIGTQRYESLTEAYNAMTEGDTIVILKEINVDDVVVFAKCCTVDTNGIGYTVNTDTENGWTAEEKTSGVFVIRNSSWFNIYGSSIKAGDCLDLYFYVDASALKDGVENYKAVIVRQRYGQANDSVTINGSEWTKYSSNLYRFCYNDIAAKEMTDKLFVTIYKGEERVSNTQMESIEGYAVRVLNTSKVKNADEGSKDQALRTALVDMLNYGTGCQQFFGNYRSDEPANRAIGEFQTYASGDITASKIEAEKHELAYGSTVSAKSSLVLTFYFKELSADLTATVSYFDHYGASRTITIPGGEFRTRTEAEIELWGVDVKGLAVADGRQEVTCVVKDSSGTEISHAVGSVESYIATTGSDHMVFRNLMKFIDSAYKYFHHGTTG